MNWYLAALKKYGVFSGRARRREYWSFFLFSMIIDFILVGIDFIIFPERSYVAWESGWLFTPLSTIYWLCTLIPWWAVTWRRLHDITRSGAWFFIILIPIIGAIISLIFMLTDSSPGPNKYGPNPKGINAPDGADSDIVFPKTI